MKELLQKKIVKIGIAVIILAVAAGIISINARSAQRQREYDGHVEAAEKYLTDLDYEQAIAEYTLALEIEPNNEEALNSLEQTYLDYAQSLADAGDYEKAVSVLEEGYAQTGRESLREKIEQVKDQQGQRIVEEWNQTQDICDKVVDNLDNGQFISDERLGESIRQLIPTLELVVESGEWHANRYLARFYYWAGEYELSSERFRQYWEERAVEAADMGQKYKIEDGLFVRNSEDDNGIRREEIYNQFGLLISDKRIAPEDGSFDEFIFEYDEKGKRISGIILSEHNSDQGGSSLGQFYAGGFWAAQGKESREYEYDDLGRVTTYTNIRYMVLNNGGTYDENVKDTYTYYDENKFTRRCVGEWFEDGVKAVDYEFSVDYEIINEYGEYAQTGEAYNDVTNYYYD